QNLAINCPLSTSALGITFGAATLDFTSSDASGRVVATVTGAPSAVFNPGDRPVTGSAPLTLDLVAGKFSSGTTTFAGPFNLGVPRKAPTLTFNVPSATLDTAGLHVDGRGTLNFSGGGSVGVTYDRLALGVTDFSITGGRASFDAAFALRAAIDSTGPVHW